MKMYVIQNKNGITANVSDCKELDHCSSRKKSYTWNPRHVTVSAIRHIKLVYEDEILNKTEVTINDLKLHDISY